MGQKGERRLNNRENLGLKRIQTSMLQGLFIQFKNIMFEIFFKPYKI